MTTEGTIMDGVHTLDADKWNNKDELNPYFTNVTGQTPEPILCKSKIHCMLVNYVTLRSSLLTKHSPTYFVPLNNPGYFY